MRSKHPPGTSLGKIFGPFATLVVAMLIVCGFSPAQAGTLGTSTSPPAANGLVLENNGTPAATFDQKEAPTAQPIAGELVALTDTRDIDLTPASFAPTLQPNNGTTSNDANRNNLTDTGPPAISAAPDIGSNTTATNGTNGFPTIHLGSAGGVPHFAP